jgi:hypothetical protein
VQVTRKEAVAAIEPADDESPTGSFDVVLSTPTKDRDGEEVKSDEWLTPLPPRITFDADHGMSVASTVGSGVPWVDDDGSLRVSGEFAGTALGQDVRSLVRDGHITSTSVAFLRRSNEKSAGVTRELLNGSFVAIPANPEAVVVGAKAGRRNAAGDLAAIQSIHDGAVHLGAACDGNKAAKAQVSETAWSQFSASDYTIEQYRRACLIGPESPSENKGDYALPVREPDGTLNRAGCHAAASTLAGGRGGVAGSDAQKRQAASKLVGLYRNQLDEDPPDSLASMAGKSAAARPSAGSKTVDQLDELRDRLAAADTSDLPESAQEAITLLLDLLGNLEPEQDDSQPAAAADESAATGAADESAAADVALRTHRLRALSVLAME